MASQRIVLPTILVCMAAGIAAHAQERKTGLLRKEDGASPGYTLMAPMRSTITYLIDIDGNVVHTWKSQHPPGQAAYLLDNGHLLRTAAVFGQRTFRGGGIGGRVEAFDWDGNLVWEFDYSDANHCQHHDIEPLPNGNVLILAWERKSESEAIEAGRDPELIERGELWPDHIIEVRPDRPRGGTIVWEWHVWDHLVQDFDRDKANYGVVKDHPERIDINFEARAAVLPPQEVERLRGLGYIGGPPGAGPDGGADWNHTNSIAYNAERDQIVLSVLGFHEIWVIDHSTTTEEARGRTGGRYGKGGDLLYRWGNPAAHGAGKAETQQFFAQHDANWIAPGCPGAGHLLVFNNGRGRPDGHYSSIDEIALPILPSGAYEQPQGKALPPERPTWRYVAEPRTDFFSGHISGAQRLPNGNTLICSGEQGRLFEVTREGRIVWEFVNPHGGEIGFGPPGGPGGRFPGGGPPGGFRGQPPGRRSPGDGAERPPGALQPPDGDRRRDDTPPDGARQPGRAGRPRGPGGFPGPGGPGRDAPGAMFRAQRYAPDHPALAGRALTPIPIPAPPEPPREPDAPQPPQQP